MRRSFLLVLLLLSACALSGAPAATTTAPPRVPAATGTAPAPSATVDPLAEMRTGIQQAVTTFGSAMNRGDAELLKQSYDTASEAKLRCVLERRLQREAESVEGPASHVYTVTAVLPQAHGVVLATVQRSGDGFVVTWPFRRIGGRWLIAEAPRTTLGKPTTVQRGAITYELYEDAAPINAAIMPIVPDAIDHVRATLGVTQTTPVRVRILPTIASGGDTCATTLSFYTYRDQRIIDVYSPHSVLYGFYDPKTGWQPSMRRLLIHEATHLITDAFFVNVFAISDWLSEGIADYVSDYPDPTLIIAAIKHDRVIGLTGPSGRTLQNLYELGPDVPLGYALSYEVVRYIVARTGSLDAFWQLCQVEPRLRLEGAMQEVFGESVAEFDQKWQHWLREEYKDR